MPYAAAESSIDVGVLRLFMSVCMYEFHDAYNCSGLVRQVSGFITVSVSA